MGAVPKGSKVTKRRSRGRSVRVATARLGRPSLAMLLLAAGLVLASAFVAIEIQRNALGRQASELQASILADTARNVDLGAAVAAKKTDDYVVNKARDYGYVLPGETLIGVQQEAVTPVAIVSPPAPSRVQKWFALFFGSR